ncbi:protoporphyrinogen oxidase HemJ [Roseobacter sp. HKCCA0434]|uniref:protoporphyrinogen oxidase HemJ n=1 Tax=Roseobacter sp. HKCCA0434 TaxID=3079297 RepID=UPI002905AFB5|nr:protoporphyrinogen oxidase HemJ [Roseobacter sp. HKCCA0434]
MFETALSLAYPWLKAGHVISVISWMAGLFYLPRLFVHHAERAEIGSEMSETFKMMEMKLYRVIMTPAMMATWLFGLSLVAIPGVVGWWFAPKFIAVVAMTWFHVWLNARRKEFLADANSRTGRTYRYMNEVPTVLMIVIVVVVFVKPF